MKRLFGWRAAHRQQKQDKELREQIRRELEQHQQLVSGSKSSKHHAQELQEVEQQPALQKSQNRPALNRKLKERSNIME